MKSAKAAWMWICRRLAVLVGRRRRRLGQLLGNDQEGDAQARKQRLGEGPEIDDPAVRIGVLQRHDGLPDIAEFAVVVVLDDPRILAPGPFQEERAAVFGKRDAQRHLVGRRKKREARFRHGRFETHALRIDRNRDWLQTAAGDDPARDHVAGVLHQAAVSGPSKELAQHGRRRPAGTRDDDLFRLAQNAARGPEMGGERSLQRRIAPFVQAVSYQVERHLQSPRAEDTRPASRRENVECGHAGKKCNLAMPTILASLRRFVAGFRSLLIADRPATSPCPAASLTKMADRSRT